MISAKEQGSWFLRSHPGLVGPHCAKRAASLPGMAFVTRSWLKRAIREGWVQQAFDEENR